MGYFQKRHGEQTNTMTSTGRSYYRERHQKEIPKSQNVLQRASRAASGLGDVLMGGARRTLQAGPTSFNSITGGLGTEFAHGIKTEALMKGGFPEIAAESLSGTTDPLFFSSPVCVALTRPALFPPPTTTISS